MRSSTLMSSSSAKSRGSGRFAGRCRRSSLARWISTTRRASPCARRRLTGSASPAGERASRRRPWHCSKELPRAALRAFEPPALLAAQILGHHALLILHLEDRLAFLRRQAGHRLLRLQRIARRAAVALHLLERARELGIRPLHRSL